MNIIWNSCFHETAHVYLFTPAPLSTPPHILTLSLLFETGLVPESAHEGQETETQPELGPSAGPQPVCPHGEPGQHWPAIPSSSTPPTAPLSSPGAGTHCHPSANTLRCSPQAPGPTPDLPVPLPKTRRATTSSSLFAHAHHAPSYCLPLFSLSTLGNRPTL